VFCVKIQVHNGQHKNGTLKVEHDKNENIPGSVRLSLFIGSNEVHITANAVLPQVELNPIFNVKSTLNVQGYKPQHYRRYTDA
jgi:hypothetical protein